MRFSATSLAFLINSRLLWPSLAKAGAALCMSLSALSVHGQDLGALPQSVSKLLQSAGFGTDTLGVVVARAHAGGAGQAGGARPAPWFSLNAERPMQPASTMKLLTSAAALDTLGPVFRAKAELASSAAPAQGILATPLVLRGLGSPDLDLRAFTSMLQSLRDGPSTGPTAPPNQGVRELRGDLVLDRRYFYPARPDLGLAPFDETPEFRYNVVPDALSLNMNLLRLRLRAGTQGVQAALVLPLDGVTVTNTFSLNDAACKDWEDTWLLPTVTKAADGNITITLQGAFPKNCAAETELNLLDRTDYADKLFRTLWRGMGGTYTGQTREAVSGDAPAPLVLATHLSRPMAEFLRDINKRSDNPTTRLLFLALGQGQSQGSDTINNVATNGPNNGQSAKNTVKTWLEGQKIDSKGLILDNGSGLSRSERITPLQLASTLQAAYASNWAPEFLASLPIVGLDGSMRNRLKTGPAAQRGRIKTGSLRDVGAVAGYVTDTKGDTHVVVAMLNHPQAGRAVAQPILDALLAWVAAGGGEGGGGP